MGLPSILAVVIGAHWAGGAVVAGALFAVWCVRLRGQSQLVEP